jgi:hypothetical protein
LSRKKPILAAAAPLFLILALTGFVLVAPVAAEEPSPVVGTQWWDWSDFRAKVGLRVFLARFTAGSIDINDAHYNLKDDYGFTDDPQPFRELYGELYVDRLGLRFSVFEDSTFHGRRDDGGVTRVTEMETMVGTFGFDLDLVRYPFVRFGINGDFYFGDFKFQDRRDAVAQDWDQFNFGPGFTIGLHAKAIPVKVRGVPITLDAKAAVPLPIRISNKETKVLDLEVSGGVRPSIWSMSSFGMSTFSVGLSGGYRYVNLESETLQNLSNVKLKARWQGAFIEVSFVY